ncbi:MAG TPA: GNAT family N-acetyltransferase, partial [Gammaproteobacteria bacterium]|nr:GNAT family N-acetyltransferase [Gammaproteobacteria bacterium]
MSRTQRNNFSIQMLTIHPATIDDFAVIESLNNSVVNLTSPMDAERIQQLHAMSSYHRVIVQDSQLMAFLLVLGPDCDYNSVNYQWFDQHYDNFAYIDRIVVRDGSRGRGLGTLLYENLFAWAISQQIGNIVCEYNVEPLNEASRKFHNTLGFQEVSLERIG